MRKVISCCAVVALLFAFLAGCSKSSSPTGPSSSNPLVGTWNMTQQVTISSTGAKDTVNADANNSQTWVINANNTFSNTQHMQSSSGNMSGTWSATADTITFTVPAIITQKDAYVIAGTALTLTYVQDMFATTETVIEKYTKQ